jgi:hypothetical protein
LAKANCLALDAGSFLIQTEYAVKVTVAGSKPVKVGCEEL